HRMAWCVVLCDFGGNRVWEQKKLQPIKHALLFRCQRFFQIGSGKELMLPAGAIEERLRFSKKGKTAESSGGVERRRGCDFGCKEPGIAWRRYAMLKRVGRRRMREAELHFRNSLITMTVRPMSVKKLEAVIAEQRCHRIDSRGGTQERILN